MKQTGLKSLARRRRVQYARKKRNLHRVKKVGGRKRHSR